MTAIGIGLLLLLGFIVGAWIAIFILTYSRIPERGLPLFSGGFLLGLMFFMLLPHALHHYHQAGLFAGICIGLFITAVINRAAKAKNFSSHSFTLIGLAVALHTLPISFTIGASLTDPVAASSLTLAAIFHHIPEAAAMTLWLASRKGSLTKLFVYFIILTAIATIPIYLGQVLRIPEQISTLLMGLSIGLLLYTVFTEFLFKKTDGISSKAAILFITAGLAAYALVSCLITFLGIK